MVHNFRPTETSLGTVCGTMDTQNSSSWSGEVRGGVARLFTAMNNCEVSTTPAQLRDAYIIKERRVWEAAHAPRKHMHSILLYHTIFLLEGHHSAFEYAAQLIRRSGKASRDLTTNPNFLSCYLVWPLLLATAARRCCQPQTGLGPLRS